MSITATGRAFVRRTSTHHIILAGTMQLPSEVDVVEGALYGACFASQRLQLLDAAPLCALIHEDQQHGSADTWLRAPIWPHTTEYGGFGIRMIQSMPEANQWTFLAVIDGAAPFGFDYSGHAWIDYDAIGMTPIRTPVDARGEAIGSLLDQHAIWPGPRGERWTTSKTPSWQRPVYASYHHLLARVGRGELTLEAA